MLDVRDFSKHGMACVGQLQHLRARDGAAHQGGPDLAAGIVPQLDGLTKYWTGLRDCTGPKTLEDLCAQTFEAGLLCEDFEGRQRELLQPFREIRGEDAPPRCKGGRSRPTPPDEQAQGVGQGQG